MVEKLSIRPFSLEDQQEAQGLILRGLGEHFGYIDESLNQDLDDIESHYLTPGHYFVVAILDGRIVGTGALVRECEGLGRIVRMSVDGNYRRQGIGKALMSHLLEIASERGYTQILLETNHDWFEALRFYRAQGFADYHRDSESCHLRLFLK